MVRLFVISFALIFSIQSFAAPSKKLPAKGKPKSAVIAPVAMAPDTLYEGWHKVFSAGQHVGYYVQRYDFDPKAKVFTSTYFLKTNALGGNITEAVSAKASEQLKPMAYQYTTTDGKTSKIIDAIFRGDRMEATVTVGKSSQKFERAIPKGAFISTFLVYVMLQNKDGLRVGNNFSYSAIAEETGEVAEGTAFIKEIVKQNGTDAFRVLNTFNKVQFISNLNAKGEALSTKSPLLGISTEVARDQASAVGSVPVDSRSLISLFGKIPGNTFGFVASSQEASPEKMETLTKKSSVSNPGKQSGVAGGQNIEIKTQEDDKPE